MSQMGASRELEQEEPFDLSQKRQGKGLSFHSDGESAKESSCHEEEEDNVFGAERYSPDMFHSDKRYSKLALSSQSCHKVKETYGDRKEKMLNGKLGEKKESQRKENQGEKNLAGNSEEHVSFGHFENSRLTQSFSDYLYFQHRNKSLKELLERKTDSQAVFLGI